MKVAIVHDYILNYGGAERVLFALTKIFPDADIHTLLYDEKLSNYFPKSKIKSSILDSMPAFIKKRHKFLLPFLPMAIENLDLSNYDIVLSSSSVFAKGVITRPGTIHICYCHSPSRFLWDYNERYLKDENFSKFFLPFIKFLIHRVRIWDRSSAERVDFWVANSDVTRKRIKKYYQKDASVIYPPVDKLESKTNITTNDFLKKPYFLVVSRLSPYKKIDIVIDAFNELGLSLVVVGEGRDMKRLKKKAKDNIYFTGFVSDDELAFIYKNCEVFVMAQEEDFGIAPIEAMQFGKPVLAYRKGGALEWLCEGRTGEFFNSQNVDSLIVGLRKIKKNIKRYEKDYIIKEAERFKFSVFRKNIIDLIEKLKK